MYALEGSIAVTGSAVQWLRDQLGHHLGRSPRSRRSRARCDDNGGVYFVPAFSGLFARTGAADARGAIVGLSRFNTNAHLARATLEAICYQSRDVAEAMVEADSGVALDLSVLKVDGGVTANNLCMQIQADVLGVPVSRPVVSGDDGARRGLRGRAGGRLLERIPTSCAPTGTRTQAVGAAMERGPARRRATPAGRRLSNVP